MELIFVSWQSKTTSILRILEGQSLLFPSKSKVGCFVMSLGALLHKGCALSKKIIILWQVSRVIGSWCFRFWFFPLYSSFQTHSSALSKQTKHSPFASVPFLELGHIYLRRASFLHFGWEVWNL